MRKRGEIAPKEQFLLFSIILSIYLLISGVKLHIHLLNVVVRFFVFLNSANLICRGTGISNYSSPFDFEITRVDSICVVKKGKKGRIMHMGNGNTRSPD